MTSLKLPQCGNNANDDGDDDDDDDDDAAAVDDVCNIYRQTEMSAGEKHLLGFRQALDTTCNTLVPHMSV